MNAASTMLAETLGVEFAEVLELLPGKQEFLLTAGHGWREEQVGCSRVSADADTVCGYLLATKKPVIVDDLSRDTRFRGTYQVHEQGAASGIACLIPGADLPFGVVGAHTVRSHRFSQDDVHFLESVANILAAAVGRKHAEDELNGFFQPSLNPMFVAGFDGVIKRCNHAMELLNGFSNEEILGTPVIDFVHADDQQATVAEIERVVAGGESPAFECRVVCKDGSQKWTVWNSTPFADRQVFFCTGQDVTDRHRAEEALAEQVRRQQAVSELGTRALSGGDLEALLDDAVAVLAQMLKVEFTTFLERLPNGRELLFKAGYGWQKEFIGKSMSPDPQYLCGRVLVSDQPIVVNDVSAETRFQPHPLAASLGIVSEMACVVPGRTDSHGVLCA